MMDRAQFMQELEKLLADISETERQDALDFIIVISMMQELRMKLRCSGNLEVPRRLRRSSRRI